MISIIIPAYNEAQTLDIFLKNLLEFIDESPLLQTYQWEIIVVNDGSQDNSRQIIEVQHQKDDRIQGINFSRNFGKEIALSAGLEHAKWDAMITIDSDGQHPISQIPNFIIEWNNGFGIVYNKRPNQKGASWIKSIASRAFYTFFNTISEFKLEAQTTDYRLLDRTVVDVFNQFGERTRLFRGIIDWIGFDKKVLIFDSELPLDKNRKPSYNYKKLFDLGLDALTSFSIAPLKFVWICGVLVTVMSSIIIVISLFDMLYLHKLGITNLWLFTGINTFLIGIVMSALGVIAYYIAGIHKESKARPLYIIKKTTDSH